MRGLLVPVVALVISGCAVITSEYPCQRLCRYVPVEAYHVRTLWREGSIYLIPPSEKSSVDARRINLSSGEIKQGGPPRGKDGLLWGPAAFSPDGKTLAWVSTTRGESNVFNSKVVLYRIGEDREFVKTGEKPGPDFRVPRRARENLYVPFWLVWASGEKTFYSLCRAYTLQRWACNRDDWEDLVRVNINNPTVLLPVSGGRALARVEARGGAHSGRNIFLIVDAPDEWHVVASIKTYLPDVLAVSPDLKYVAMSVWGPGRADGDGVPKTVWLVQLSDGRMVKVLYSTPGVMSAAFSPDGRRLACLTWHRSGRMDKFVPTRAYLDVVDLYQALERVQSDRTLPHEDEASEVRDEIDLQTWSYEEAPVMTLEEVRAFSQGKERTLRRTE